MFNIHDLRATQNFRVFDTICKREKIEFFLMVNVIKLLQSTLNVGEDLFDLRIGFERVNDKILLEYVKNNKGSLLLDIGDSAFAVKSDTYFLLKEIYDMQKKEEANSSEFAKKHNFYIL